MKYSKKITAFLLSVLIVFTCFCAYTSAEDSSAPDIVRSDNIYGNTYYYGRFGSTVKSYFNAMPDGTYLRTEYVDGSVYCERYNSSFNLLSSVKIKTELPVYGGIHFGENYNYVVTGQNNESDDPKLEVIRITRYSKSWEKIDSASIYGANTYMPFDVSAVRFTEKGDYLYIYTAHEMFMTHDGKHHQANMLIVLDTRNMSVTDNNCEIMNNSTGYVSHSFNQFIAFDEDTNSIITADHGDSLPRSIVMFRYNNQAGGSELNFPEKAEVFRISGVNGDNDTYVSMGGIAVTDNNYLTAFSSADQSASDPSSLPRNVYVTAVPKKSFNDGAVKTVMLTNYRKTDAQSADTPYIIAINDSKYLVMWNNMVSGSFNNTVSYVFTDENGNKLSDIYTSDAALSDCEPILCGEKVMWYVTKKSAPAFFSLDINNPEKIKIEKCYHPCESKDILYTTCDINGIVQYSCLFCDYEYKEAVPSTGHKDTNGDGVCDVCLNYIPTKNSTARAEFDKKAYVLGTGKAYLTVYADRGVRITGITVSNTFSGYLRGGNVFELSLSDFDLGMYRFYVKLSDKQVITADLIISEDGKVPDIYENPPEPVTVPSSQGTTAKDETSTLTETTTADTQSETTTNAPVEPTTKAPDEPTTNAPVEPTSETPEYTTKDDAATTQSVSEQPTTAEAPTHDKYIMGDLDGDGNISAADARIALRISAKLHNATEIQLICADVIHDEVINASDARKILRVAAKIDSFKAIPHNYCRADVP